jgi:hydrogenase maturation protease
MGVKRHTNKAEERCPDEKEGAPLSNQAARRRPSEKGLIIGYGNPDREDDGVAWHILKGLAERLGRPAPDLETGGLDQLGQSSDLLFVLQLTPELAELIAGYDQICFVDAHTGIYPEDLRFETIDAEFQTSPFTHHMTPQTCLMLARTLYGRTPQGIVVSVRGHRFGFSHTLSTQTTQLAEEAIERIVSCWHNTLPIQNSAI